VQTGALPNGRRAQLVLEETDDLLVRQEQARAEPRALVRDGANLAVRLSVDEVDALPLDDVVEAVDVIGRRAWGNEIDPVDLGPLQVIAVTVGPDQIHWLRAVP
jgi:hypothetical protein